MHKEVLEEMGTPCGNGIFFFFKSKTEFFYLDKDNMYHYLCTETDAIATEYTIA